MEKKTVAVIFGGRSGEHEVSLVSARAIIDVIDRKRFRILPVAILKNGHWIAGVDARKYLKSGQAPRASAIASFAPGKIQGHRTDIAFPIIHGTFGEDGKLQGLLEMMDIPYVGCGVAGSAIGMDKDIQKRLLDHAAIPTAKALSVIDAEWKEHAAAIRRQAGKTIGYPLFVKPAHMGSSVGVVKVNRPQELAQAMRDAFRCDYKVLIERAVPNAREIECSVLGNGPYEVAGPGEVKPSNEFYDFYAKYVDDASTVLIAAPMNARLRRDIRRAAIRACEVLGVEGMARVDFLLKRGTARWVLNEINTLPGFTSISMYPKLWAQEGRSFTRLVTDLIGLALKRHRKSTKKVYSFNSGSDWYK